MKAIRSISIAAGIMLLAPAAALAGNPSAPPGDAGSVQEEIVASLPVTAPTSSGGVPEAAEGVASVSSGVLPFTGLDLALFAVAGLLLVAAGILLRRRTSERGQ